MKITSDIMGIPAPVFIMLLPIAIVGFYFNYALVGLVIYLITGFFLRKLFFKDYLKLETTLGPSPFKTSVLIKGLDKSFLKKLDHTIDTNEKIIFSCPNNILLKNALFSYVECHLGQCSFETSKDISFKTAPLDINVKLLSCPTRQDLELGISLLRKRGWVIDGEYAQQSNLISTVHTQRMVYGN